MVNVLIAGHDDQSGPELYWIDYLGAMNKVLLTEHNISSFIYLPKPKKEIPLWNHPSGSHSLLFLMADPLWCPWVWSTFHSGNHGPQLPKEPDSGRGQGSAAQMHSRAENALPHQPARLQCQGY